MRSNINNKMGITKILMIILVCSYSITYADMTAYLSCAQVSDDAFSDALEENYAQEILDVGEIYSYYTTDALICGVMTAIGVAKLFKNLPNALESVVTSHVVSDMGDDTEGYCWVGDVRPSAERRMRKEAATERAGLNSAHTGEIFLCETFAPAPSPNIVFGPDAITETDFYSFEYPQLLSLYSGQYLDCYTYFISATESVTECTYYYNQWSLP